MGLTTIWDVHRNTLKCQILSRAREGANGALWMAADVPALLSRWEGSRDYFPCHGARRWICGYCVDGVDRAASPVAGKEPTLTRRPA